ncbi:MAG: YlaF family protein [Lysinibacillus sp.]|nr:YlaF family protein [Lysinibacillus sp.]
MNKAKVVMFIFALAALLSMISIGYAIAIQSIFAIIASVAALGFVMGIGFRTKRKFRENGLL